MKSYTCSLLITLIASSLPLEAKLAPFELSEEWETKVHDLAPGTPATVPAKERKLLTFSLATGFVHWCIPHTDAVIEILGKKSGAYTVENSTDIEAFSWENLSRYDAIVLNNNCPDRKDRDMFRDVLINKMDQFGGKYRDMPAPEREKLAEKLYQNLTRYVAEGGGLILLHGAITNFNNSDEFSSMVGGSFDFHPPQQDVTLLPASPGHPLLKPFGNKPFVHYDEPYFLKGAYDQLNFLPLLEMDMTKMKENKKLQQPPDIPRYVAWVKPYKKGRVFFCSPSHNAQSFERPELLQFILGGVQYATGDLKCADQPIPAHD